MIRQTSEISQFKQKLRDSLMKEISTYPTVKIAQKNNVYLTGYTEDVVYFIESGEVKLLIFSPEGKECLLAIHSSGDIFGELCIGHIGERVETAIAITDTQLKTIPSDKFLAHLIKESLLEDFVQYLAVQVVERQRIIANLGIIDNEE